MKKIEKIVWGLIIVALGAVLALNACGVTNWNIWFDGWWTLFLIVPSFCSLIAGKGKVSAAIGLGFGVFLLLACRNIISFDLIWKLILPAFVILIGLKLIFGGFFGKKKKKELRVEISGVDNRPSSRACEAIFTSSEISFTGEVFDGAQLSAVFGGVKCDLTGAVISSDCTVRAETVFGGITLIVPESVNVSVKSSCLFGGVSDKRRKIERSDAPTVTVNAEALFGGITILGKDEK